MITIGYCTKKENKEHQAHLLKVAGTPKVEIIEIVNEGNRSLTECYNEILEKSKYDIVLFLHDDVLIETKQIATKIDRLFNNNIEFSIIGVAGTKHLSNSGRWWDDRSSMFGKVRHTNSGKSWLSEYSGDLGKNLEEVVLVDGVFFAVKKSRLKENFDTNVKGFHFYDVDFCFRNFISGTKIGVTTEIRVNHMSIGMTNEQWEENRKAFVEKYHSELPRRIKQDFKNKKLSVLIGCLNFQGLTGSEISTLETAIGLSNEGCDVSVISNTISNDFAKKCEKNKIKLYHISQPPGYRMGDGVWQIETNQGLQVSKPNTLYLVSPINFDVIHANHKPITEQLLRLYPDSKFINIVRSEVIELEDPIIDDKIKKYVAIRPSIKDHLIKNFNIDADKIEVIYNPFDSNRFKPMKLPSGTEKKVTLFVGTMDYLRKNPIVDLVTKCGEENKELWLVGKDNDNYAKILANDFEHVKYFPPTDKIEEYFYKCDETAGIMLGRTTIEGFLCGKPAIIYYVDKYGEIISNEFLDVPEDLSIFNQETIINNYKKLYIETYNG
jgi:glycosyltransferase involved in cell wall biosynthesis